MVRYEDSPGLVKHVRFGKVSDDALTALRDFPGVKAIVLHTHGKTGEHPHWHVWVELTEPATNQTLRNRLKRISVFAGYSGQNDWSFRNHDSWESWSRYVIKNPTHKVLLNHLDLNELSEAANGEYAALVAPATAIEHVGAVATVAYKIQKPRESQQLKAKFVRYLLNEIKWEHECITMENYSWRKSQICRECVKYFQNGIPSTQAAVCIEHAIYYFGNSDVKSHLEDLMETFLSDRKILRC